MLRLNGMIRLTEVEMKRLELITGFVPVGIRTVQDLEDFICRCKTQYQDNSIEARRLHRLFDEEAMKCITA